LKSFLLTLVIWGALFALLWYGAHARFYPPGDWIGALVASFGLALGIGGIRKARLERRDARLVEREDPPQDGRRVAIVGTLESVDPAGLLKAPLSGTECVIYDYEISHIPKLPPLLDKSKNSNQQPSPVIDRSGLAMTPMAIRSDLGSVRLLAFPGLERFPRSALTGDVPARAREYIAATSWTDQSILNVTSQVKKATGDRSGHLRIDWKSTSHDDLDSAMYMERAVPAGAKACVIGLYSAADNAIVPQANVGGTRLIQGDHDEALELVRDKGTGTIIGAVFFIAVVAPATFGILTIRENYNEKNHKPTARSARVEAFYDAVKAGDLAQVQQGIRQGMDVNGLSDGVPPLSFAHDAATASALLDAGANVELRSKNGYTPLMSAANDDRLDILRLLLAHHADITATDSTLHKTALQHALEYDQQGAAKILREWTGSSFPH
jgi:hypothetical protein